MILHGDCRTELATMADASVDSIVTDPPYELGFMGKKWDASGIAYDPEVWSQCLRVLKPGGHLCAFGGTRTYHRMTCAIEDAGFEIRDSLHWIYGSGFPKSLDVSKAIDKAFGAQREVVGRRKGIVSNGQGRYNWHAEGTAGSGGEFEVTVPATPAAAAAGWGTALKPAHEPIVLARKPLAGTVATNVMEYGTGALNIDGCRVGMANGETNPSIARYASTSQTGNAGWEHVNRGARFTEQTAEAMAQGRWPANIILTHAPECETECVAGCPVATLNEQSGYQRDAVTVNRNRKGATTSWFHKTDVREAETQTYGSGGGASRYFTTTTWDPDLDVPFLYVAKPSRKERNAGLDGMPGRFAPTMGNGIGGKEHDPGTATPKANFHPTVKPVALIRYLIRLITPPDGVVLDPFLGSGTTAVAATLEGFTWVGCELTAEYLPIIEARVAWATSKAQPATYQLTLEDAQE